MEQNLFVVAAVVTIVGGSGIIGVVISILRNKELIKSTIADWTRYWRKTIYFVTSHSKLGDVTLYLFFCGEETSLFYPSTYENCEPYILAMRVIHYDIFYPSNSNRDHSEWRAMPVEPLSKDEYPCIIQFIGECKFRFRLSNDNGGSITDPDPYKFKTERKECLKKCEIKYYKKAPNPQKRWKSKDR